MKKGFYLFGTIKMLSYFFLSSRNLVWLDLSITNVVMYSNSLIFVNVTYKCLLMLMVLFLHWWSSSVNEWSHIPLRCGAALLPIFIKKKKKVIVWFLCDYVYVSYQFKLKESLDSGKISPDIYRVFQMATNPEMGRGFNFFL